MDYFPNRDGECFFTSLANILLYKYNDQKIAKKVINDCRSHPLVFPNGGTLGTTWPFFTKYLSEGKYYGQLYVGPSYIENHETFAESLYDKETFELYEYSVFDELDSIIETGSYSGETPTIIALSLENTHHAIVDLGDDKIINDGVVQTVEDISNIIAILQVTKS